MNRVTYRYVAPAGLVLGVMIGYRCAGYWFAGCMVVGCRLSFQTFFILSCDVDNYQRPALLFDPDSDLIVAVSGDVPFFGLILCNSLLHLTVQKKISCREFETFVSGKI